MKCSMKDNNIACQKFNPTHAHKLLIRVAQEYLANTIYASMVTTEPLMKFKPIWINANLPVIGKIFGHNQLTS